MTITSTVLMEDQIFYCFAKKGVKSESLHLYTVGPRSQVILWWVAVFIKVGVQGRCEREDVQKFWMGWKRSKLIPMKEMKLSPERGCGAGGGEKCQLGIW